LDNDRGPNPELITTIKSTPYTFQKALSIVIMQNCASKNLLSEAYSYVDSHTDIVNNMA